MSWNLKSKITSTGTNETKISLERPVGEIQTPDGQQILVGENENEVLVYDEGYSQWSKKSKITGSYSLKSKI